MSDEVKMKVYKDALNRVWKDLEEIKRAAGGGKREENVTEVAILAQDAKDRVTHALAGPATIYMNEEELAEEERKQDAMYKGFDAVDADQRENGVRLDQLIKIKCPNCGGTMSYTVSSYNRHRWFECDGCGCGAGE